jgi:hypothetical protein
MHLLLLLTLFAQGPEGYSGTRTLQAAAQDQMSRELLINGARHAPDKAAEQAARRQEMNYDERQFVQQFNKFTRLLKQFTDHYNTRHTIDVKELQAVKKAWHDIEKRDSSFRETETHGTQ